MRLIYSALVLSALGACAPAIPDSASGVGFDNSSEAQQRREAELTGTGTTLASPLAVSQEALPAGATTATTTTATATGPAAPVIVEVAAITPAPLPAAAQVQPLTSSSTGSTDDIARETAAALAAANANSGVAPLQASPSNPAPASFSNPGISDENNFATVSNTRSIESDAEQIARNKAQYQQVPAAPVPSRTGTAQPNIVSYALATNHARGTKVHTRSGFNRDAKAARNCAAFPSPDQAQIAFLSSGGPQKDKRGLDPDGDGYACTWDPTPFRRAVQN